MKKSIRNYSGDISFRAFEENDKRYLEGYAVVFNKRSKLISENNRLFYEIIKPEAFNDVLKSEDLNVVLTFNHERDRVIARTKSGTLKLSLDEYGLRFIAEVPNTTLGNDIYELVKRGDLFENSFAFAVKKNDDEWTKDENGNDLRIIKKVSRLFDVSIVVDAAYSDTYVMARDEDNINYEEHIEPQPGESKDEFISKCVKYLMDTGETNDVDQAAAICYKYWNEHSMKQDKSSANSEAKIEDQKENLELTRMKMKFQLLKLKGIKK